MYNTINVALVSYLFIYNICIYISTSVYKTFSFMPPHISISFYFLFYLILFYMYIFDLFLHVSFAPTLLDEFLLALFYFFLYYLYAVHCWRSLGVKIVIANNYAVAVHMTITPLNIECSKTGTWNTHTYIIKYEIRPM